MLLLTRFQDGDQNKFKAILLQAVDNITLQIFSLKGQTTRSVTLDILLDENGMLLYHNANKN